MSNLFGGLPSNDTIQRQALANKYNAARSNLLMMIIFSAFNLLMLATGSGVYFLFSASVPYVLTDTAMFFCGMYPKELYEGFEGMFFMNKSFFVVMLIISILILAIYLLCWLFSKNNKVAWLTVSLVLFSIDTLVMFACYGISSDMIANIIFHIWLIVILAIGINAHYKLKKMPEKNVMIEAEFTEVDTDGVGNEGENSIEEPKKIVPESKPIRIVETDVKAKILLDAEVYGYTIVYRRVKRTNELVINGEVYDEYTALAEMPHMLTANVGDHSFAAGMDNTSHSFIMVDGRVVKTKLRLV